MLLPREEAHRPWAYQKPPVLTIQVEERYDAQEGKPDWPHPGIPDPLASHPTFSGEGEVHMIAKDSRDQTRAGGCKGVTRFDVSGMTGEYVIVNDPAETVRNPGG